MDITIELSYAGLQLTVQGPSDVVGLIKSELAPFFGSKASASAPVIGRLRLHLSGIPLGVSEAFETLPGQKVVIDTSLYRHLASDGWRWGDDGRYLIRIDLTQTWIAFDRAGGTIDLWQASRELCVRDAVRLIKGLFTPALESAGAVQLHSSAVTIDGGATLIIADMWQGKTTLLLEFLANFRAAQLSCDTVVLRVRPNDGFQVCGWPSPFSVSHGTLADHPSLYEFFPQERRSTPYDVLWSEGKKAVLTSQQVVERFATRIDPSCDRLDLCIVARFKPEEPTRIERLTDVQSLVGHLRQTYLGSRDPIYHNWHGYTFCDNETIDANIVRTAHALFKSVDVRVLTWGPSSVSLLNRVGRLAQAHKHVGYLLAPPTAGQ